MLVTNGDLVVDVRDMDSQQRTTTLLALMCGAVVPVMPYPWYGAEMVKLVRQPHRAYPTCDAREWPRSRSWDRPKAEYPWCPNSARYGYGEQHVCQEHAAQMVFGVDVKGILLNGKWRNRPAAPDDAVTT